MRFALVISVAVLLTPAALTARPATSGLHAAQAVTDISAAKKKKPAKKPKEEYLKAAPGTGPSGPKQ
jgi:hypothetical protein